MKILLQKGLLFILCVQMSINCASIIHGTSQEIDIRSAPDEAEVWIDEIKYGDTPTRVTLKRKNDYIVRISKEGYKDVMVKIEGKTSAWIIGNIIFGGIIGCGVDFINGAAYDLKPESLDVNLTELQAYNNNLIEIPQAALEDVKKIRFLAEDGSEELVLEIDWIE